MKRLNPIVSWVLLCVTGLVWNSAASGQGRGGDKGDKPKRPPRVVVVPHDTTVELGGIAAFEAYLMEPDGNRKDTTFAWSVDGRIGSVSDAGVFRAERTGAGSVVATAGRISGTAGIRVVNPDWKLRYRVEITPNDTLVLTGQGVRFSARLRDKDGNLKDTTFTWEVLNGFVGNINRRDGVFTALRSGNTVVTARAGSLVGRARVAVRLDSAGWAARRAGLHVAVEPRDTVTAIGGRIQFHAALLDSNGTAIDTAFTWSLEGGDFGTVDPTGLFTADTSGHGFVFASTGTLSGRAHVTVLRDTAAYDSLRNRWKNRIRLVVEPRDTVVLVGQTVRLRAFLVDTTGLKTETDVRWQLLGSRAGRIDSDGLFTAERRGTVLARAVKERYTAMARVMVAVTPRDTSDADADSAQVGFKDREGRAVGNIHRMGEKDVLKIAGLPFPLNVLNGGELVFPPGCLPGNITIQITLPEGTAAGADSAEFPGSILNGASFSVTMDGVPVSPYVFGFPVQVSFPLHSGLLAALGLTPEDLGVFFAGLDGSLDSTGVSNVVVDTALGLVYAEVEHFSDVVVAPKRGVTAVPSGSGALPGASRLYANYPNPFNPDTRIRFDLSGTRNRNVTVKIYNVMGREIRTLWNGPCAPGSHTVTWDGRDERGLAMGSGVYLVRLEGQDLRQTRRMVLLK